MPQNIITADKQYAGLNGWLKKHGCKSLFLVCDDSVRYMEAFGNWLQTLETGEVRLTVFRDFQPNPLYESVVSGVALFRAGQCDGLMAVGGGSAIDVAKCIKLYSGLPGNGENGAWLSQKTSSSPLPFLVMPTTAGTGSEATRYAVVYYNGVKQSITSESMIPETVLMDPGVLKTLPLYQKKATMSDALCHAVESFWSVNSTEESRRFSGEAIAGVLAHMDGYLSNTEEGNAGMMSAAYTAGKAINITQTTAGHAMCYKLTSLFRIAHGHAALLCDRVLFSWMAEHTDRCTDPRGEAFLRDVFRQIAEAMGCGTATEAAVKLNDIFLSLELSVPSAEPAQFEELKNSVNPVRLKNHPIALDTDTIDSLYHMILR